MPHLDTFVQESTAATNHMRCLLAPDPTTTAAAAAGCLHLSAGCLEGTTVLNSHGTDCSVPRILRTARKARALIFCGSFSPVWFFWPGICDAEAVSVQHIRVRCCRLPSAHFLGMIRYNLSFMCSCILLKAVLLYTKPSTTFG